MRRVAPPDGGPGLTVEEFARLPGDGNRTELVRGRVVREPPAGFEHGDLAARVAHRLREFVVHEDLGRVVGAETGFVLFESPVTIRAPDAAFVASDRVPADRTGFARLAPDLAVEIVSPSNTMTEINDKICDYLEAGTRMVWIIESRRKTITVYRSRDDIRILGEGDEVDGGDVLPGFSLRVRDLFAD